MPIVIKPLLADQREEALSFIQPYESECVNLASEILRGGTDCWALYYADQEASQTSGTGNESKPAMLDCRISRNIRARDQARANSGIEMYFWR